MDSTPLGPNPKARRLIAAAVAACAPLPAFAADVGSSALVTYMFFAFVASVVIVLLLHAALGEEGGYERDDDRGDALGFPRYVRAQQERSLDVARRPRA